MQKPTTRWAFELAVDLLPSLRTPESHLGCAGLQRPAEACLFRHGNIVGHVHKQTAARQFRVEVNHVLAG
jgi:hypothetical protein